MEAEELQRRYEYESQKQEKFDKASTVEALKAWIEEYLL
jgi:hypothetical protein